MAPSGLSRLPLVTVSKNHQRADPLEIQRLLSIPVRAALRVRAIGCRAEVEDGGLYYLRTWVVGISVWLQKYARRQRPASMIGGFAE
jgi:hypothetical protein